MNLLAIILLMEWFCDTQLTHIHIFGLQTIHRKYVVYFPYHISENKQY